MLVNANKSLSKISTYYHVFRCSNVTYSISVVQIKCTNKSNIKPYMFVVVSNVPHAMSNNYILVILLTKIQLHVKLSLVFTRI